MRASGMGNHAPSFKTGKGSRLSPDISQRV